jgi:hypothetical protein
VANDGVAAEDRGVGVDHHIIAYRGVTLGVGQFLPHAGRPQGDALVELHAIPDHRRFPHHHAGAVIDAEGGADTGARVNVDPRFAVRQFTDEAGHQRHAQLMQRMRNAVRAHGPEAGIREDHLVAAGGGGIALIVRPGVEQQRLMDRPASGP